MRRADKQIENPDEVLALLRKATVCRLAMVHHGRPYLVPVNFAFKEKVLYFHSARAGAKVEALRENPQVCFEVDFEDGIVKGKTACSWGTVYRSVVGFGQAFFISDRAGKIEALNILMEKFSGDVVQSYSEEALDKVLVIGINVESITGKKSG
ncbi:MAG TPA: pyridoxamine 5'-phosphate oxidase family protein [Smithellaceae bacterium]|nr:pyridoxamine 5'-phosphate oxidase family protein [Smithellaceae bacterium]